MAPADEISNSGEFSHAKEGDVGDEDVFLDNEDGDGLLPHHGNGNDGGDRGIDKWDAADDQSDSRSDDSDLGEWDKTRKAKAAAFSSRFSRGPGPSAHLPIDSEEDESSSAEESSVRKQHMFT